MGAFDKNFSGRSEPLSFSLLRNYALAFVLLAAVSAVAGFEVGHLRAIWVDLKLGPPTTSPASISQLTSDPVNAEFAELTRLAPQQQAERLLERAIRRQQGTLDLIRDNVEGWRGRVQNTDHLFDLVLTAMKSEDLRVRSAAVEIDLVANNLPKSPKSVARLVTEIRKDPA